MGKSLHFALPLLTPIPTTSYSWQDTLKPFGINMAASIASHMPCHASLALLTCEQSVASSWK